ncbi:MAG TPA: HNH endonuclease signature motif containing protein [Solirubrobacterales bacterium]|nr:HNH endonuclease signature motif containing protein [Solirubrobacterales bacterium]
MDEALQQLRLLAKRLTEIERIAAAGSGRREELDDFIGELRAAQLQLFGPRPRSQKGAGAKARILTYLMDRVGQEVRGEELAEVSGIQEWPRRVRELRVQEGYEIREVGESTYRLESLKPDKQRAQIWKRANVIRRQPGSGLERIAALFDASVGEVITREQIDYVGKIAEGSRRVRELRDEHGLPIDSHIDDPILGSGEYRLTSNDPADRRDPLQRLYPEGLRQRVFERDNYTCQICGRNREKAEAAGDTRFYLEIHHKVAVADELAEMPKAERNDIENLMTLCHRDHLEQTAELQRRRRQHRKD